MSALSLSDSLLDNTATEGFRVSKALDTPAHPEATNVLEMGGMPPANQMQKIVLRLIMKGTTISEIATTVQMTQEAILKIVRSEWAQKEFERISKEAPSSQSSMRNLLRLFTPIAILRLGEIASSKNENAALRAIQLILENSIAPIKEKDLGDDKKTTTEEAQREKEELDRQIAAYEKRREERKVS